MKLLVIIYSCLISFLATTHVARAADEAAESTAAIVVYQGEMVSPFAVYVGDPAGWSVPAGTGDRRSHEGVVELTQGGEPSALAVTFSGRREGQFFVGSDPPLDLRAMSAEAGALVFVLKTKEPPTKPVTLRIGCGYPCGADADVTGLLESVPVDRWVRVSLDLRCFVQQGLNAANVDTPFQLLTQGRLSLSVADIRFVAGVGPDATVSCG